MFARLFGVIIATTPVTTGDLEAYIFQSRYDPQVVLVNRFLAGNHWMGVNNWDRGVGEPDVVYSKEDRRTSWRSHLERTLTEGRYKEWAENMKWRFNCWNALDNVLNQGRYKITEYTRNSSLQQLKDWLGDEAFYAGRMPSPIPDYGDRIKWLQGAWEANKGSLNKLSPTALPDWIELVQVDDEFPGD